MYIYPYVFPFSLIIQYIMFKMYILDTHAKRNILYYYMFTLMNVNAISNIIILSDYINPLLVYNVNMSILMILSVMMKRVTNYIVNNKIYYIFIPGSICKSKYPQKNMV